MEQSKVLDSVHFGSWVNDIDFTGGNQDDKKFKILENEISRKKIQNETKVNLSFSRNNEYLVKDNNEIDFNKIPELPKSFDIKYSKKYSKKVHKWRGVIIEVDSKKFKARLTDLTDGGTDEIGIFENNEISPDDMSLLKEGAIFYWSIGLFMENGQLRKISDIRLQRLIVMESEDYDNALDNFNKNYFNLKEKKIEDTA